MFLVFSLLAERRQFFQPVLLLRTEGIVAHLFIPVKHSTKLFCLHLNMFFKTGVYSSTTTSYQFAAFARARTCVVEVEYSIVDQHCLDIIGKNEGERLAALASMQEQNHKVHEIWERLATELLTRQDARSVTDPRCYVVQCIRKRNAQE